MLRLCPTSAPELPAVIDYLNRIFGPATAAYFENKPLADWKFYAPHPLWPDSSRSYVLDRDGEWCGHGAASPVTYALPGANVSSQQVIDWAGSSTVPGAGMLIYRELLRLSDTLLAIGGSQDARRVISQAKMFRQLPSAWHFFLPLRPWAGLRDQPFHWKTLPKAARNWWWSTKRQAPGRWTARPASSLPPDLPFSSWQNHLAPVVPIHRSTEWLRYLMTCPAAALSVLLLEGPDGHRGYSLISRLGNQARLADLLISSAQPADWAAASAAVAATLARDPACDLLLALTSVPLLQSALLATGFRREAEMPIYLADPRKRLTAAGTLEINYLVGDAFYLPG